MNYDENLLISAACEARALAYAPYSRFSVGAALMTSTGKIITGCNVENISYGLTLCAERNAVVTAVSQGHRDFLALAVVADTDLPISPCGACRQVLAEFNPDCQIILATIKGQILRFTLTDLFPRAKTGILNQ